MLLGEQHDNPYHHLLQARVIQLLLASGVRPTVAFEMFASDRAGAIKDCQAPPTCSVDEFRYAVEWDASGWPAWELYQPIFKTVIGAHLPDRRRRHSRPPRCGSWSRRDTDRAAERAEWIGWLGLERAMPPEERTELAEEIRESHCNLAPEDVLPGMIRGQRARDAHLAQMLERAAAERRHAVVLIAGFGHTRTDRGVPTYFVGLGRPRRFHAQPRVRRSAEDKYPSPRDYARRFDGDLCPSTSFGSPKRSSATIRAKANREKLEAIGSKPTGTRAK